VKALKKRKPEWQLQEAKNALSEVVNRALTEGVQTITRHGKPVVVVLSQEEFRKMESKKKEGTGADLLKVLQACPDGELLARAIEDSRVRTPVRRLDL
jgi:prevent-host-death family protein